MSSPSGAYQAFLADPAADAMADNAALHYITTLTSIHGPAAIIKHLIVQAKLLKKSNKVLSVMECPDKTCMDVETTIEFVAGGGAYLPGLDDNFVTDRTAIFPILHLVYFDSNAKISQIRLYWDQGSLLKQIEVIGARARGWPIRDGREQARLIAASSGPAALPPSSHPVPEAVDQVTITNYSLAKNRDAVGAAEDPYASLSFFQHRNANQDSTYAAEPIGPRARPSSKHHQRDFSKLFAGDEVDSPTEAPKSSSLESSVKPGPTDYALLFAGPTDEESTASVSTPSPTKQRIPVKTGAGKNFQPNRLFEETNEDRIQGTPLSVKTNGKKYDHFEFGDGDDDQTTPRVAQEASRNRSKHMSQWDFEDFVTPEKPPHKVLGQAVRHFGWSDDEEETSPVRRLAVHRARPDADAHFEFVDDSPVDPRRTSNSSRRHLQKTGLGLHRDQDLHSTSGHESADKQMRKGDQSLRTLGNAINNENRKKDFGAQWEMTDISPRPEHNEFENSKSVNSKPLKPVAEDRKKAIKGLDASWGLYDQSPESVKKENAGVGFHGIKTMGNGMGGRKGAEPAWSLGDDEPEAARPSEGPQPAAATTRSKGFWDF